MVGKVANIKDLHLKRNFFCSFELEMCKIGFGFPYSIWSGADVGLDLTTKINSHLPPQHSFCKYMSTSLDQNNYNGAFVNKNILKTLYL